MHTSKLKACPEFLFFSILDAPFILMQLETFHQYPYLCHASASPSGEDLQTRSVAYSSFGGGGKKKKKKSLAYPLG